MNVNRTSLELQPGIWKYRFSKIEQLSKSSPAHIGPERSHRPKFSVTDRILSCAALWIVVCRVLTAHIPLQT